MNKKISQEKYDSSEDSNGEDSSFEEEDTFINRRIIESHSTRVNLNELKEKHTKYINMNIVKTEELPGKEIQLRILIINKGNDCKNNLKEKEQNIIEMKKFVEYYNKYEKVSNKKSPGKRKNIKNQFIDIIGNFDESKSLKPELNNIKPGSFRESNLKNLSVLHLSNTRPTENLALKSLKNSNFHLSQLSSNANPPNSNRESVISHDDKSSIILRKSKYILNKEIAGKK